MINSIDQNGYKSPASTIGTLLIVNFHIKRTDSSQPEKRDTRGFIISNKTLGEIGLECGAFIKAPDSSNEYYINQQIGEKNKCELDIKWKDLIIEPIEITFPQNLEKARRLSGIQNELSDFNGVIAGVGALGSQLADMWSKEGWGNWTYIDDDYIKPHNIYRHIARDCSIGQRKVNVVHQFSSLNYQLNNTGSAIYGKAHEFSNTEIETAYQNSDILIDATTTLEAPRDISLNENAPRSVSVFITPSGKSSVLLIEDKDLSIRLNSLEAQYYRAIINNEWGENHLSGHEGHIWTGAGCRDVSVIIPQELILLHAAILARHIRFLQQKSESVIRIWEVKDENGSVICHDIPVNKPIINILGEWHIVYDDFIQNKMTALRDESLPAETGGIIVGYIDQKQKYIYIVDVLNAPSDSISDNTSFVRGISGVNDELKIIMNKTANIVEYIGEWHSHPRNSTSIPSNYDINLLNYLSLNLSIEGKPGLIMIAGENDYSISLYEE